MFKYNEEVYISWGFYEGQYWIIKKETKDWYWVELRDWKMKTVPFKYLIPYENSMEYKKHKAANLMYKQKIKEYNNLSLLAQLFTSDPEEEDDYFYLY